MALPVYLAMTPWEMEHRELPPRCGWMACHFSPYGQGLSNLPRVLPADSLVIVNDRIPPWGHDPKLMVQQLQEVIDTLSPRGVLLDFQRPYNEETAKITQVLSTLPCPVAVTETYAKSCGCGVFLSPVPLNKPLQQHLSPWQGREIWLELDYSGLSLTVTRDGCAAAEEAVSLEEPVLTDSRLHCHYSIRLQKEQAVFSLLRQENDLVSLTEEAEQAGVTLAAGLYQELSGVLFVHGIS